MTKCKYSQLHYHLLNYIINNIYVTQVTGTQLYHCNKQELSFIVQICTCMTKMQ